MDELARDPRWRSRTGACCYLCFAPFLGFMGFAYMGHRSGRKAYKRNAKIYLGLTAAGFLLLLIPAFAEFFGDDPFKLYPYRTYESTNWLVIPAMLLWLGGYAARVIHTLSSRQKFLEYMAMLETTAPAEHPLMKDSVWRVENLGWKRWAYLPGLGSVSLLRQAWVLKKKPYAVCAALCLLPYLLQGFMLHFSGEYFNSGAGNLTVLLSPVLISVYAGILLWNRLTAEDVLRRLAPVQGADRDAYPHLADLKWKNTQTGWKFWTFLPYVGGAGLIRGGIQAKDRTVRSRGLVLLILTFLMQAADIAVRILFRRGLFSGLTNYQIRPVLHLAELFVFGTLWALGGYMGSAVRWRLLKERAQLLGGYDSEMDREIDQMNRFRSRGVRRMDAGAPVSGSNAGAHAEQRPSPAAGSGAKTGPSFAAPGAQAPKNLPRGSRPEAGPAGSPSPAPEMRAAGSTPSGIRQAQPSAPPARPAQQTAPAARPATPERFRRRPEVSGPDTAPKKGVDLNSCTQEELMTLPGVDLITAKKALAYRAEHGFFRSVDEFIEVFGIKPHFAVQIFERASADPLPAKKEAAAQPSYEAPKGVRRTLDF